MKGSGRSSSQRTLNTIGSRRGKKNYDNGHYDDDDDDDDDDDYDDHDYDDNDYNVFVFIPKDIKQLWFQGNPINYDDDDEIDDNDDDDDGDGDDEDDNYDGYGGFFLHKDFFL